MDFDVAGTLRPKKLPLRLRDYHLFQGGCAPSALFYLLGSRIMQ